MPTASAKQKREARDIVRRRDGHRCQMCGASVLNIPSSVHHRINKGAGGSAKLERPSLLVRLCGDGVRGCHGWVTNEPRMAGLTGWLLPKNNPDIDSTREPLLTYAGWVLLDDAGNRMACATPDRVGWVLPPGGAA